MNIFTLIGGLVLIILLFISIYIGLHWCILPLKVSSIHEELFKIRLLLEEINNEK